MGRLTERLRQLATIVVLAATLSACAATRQPQSILPVELEPPVLRLSDFRLVPEPPPDVLARYTVSADGRIVDGPRAGPNEGIDHSALLTNRTIAETFRYVAFGAELMRANDEPENANARIARQAIWRIKKHDRPVEIVDLHQPRAKDESYDRHLALAIAGIREATGVIVVRSEKATAERVTIFSITTDGSNDALRAAARLNATADRMADRPSAAKALRIMAKTVVRNEVAMDGSCTVSPGFDADGRMSTFVMFNSIGRPFSDQCAYEETMQSMGLFNDDDRAFGTMFTDSYKYYRRPTELDWLMLEVLYDPRLRHGMTPTEAMPVVRRILAEKRPYGEATRRPTGS